MLQQIQALVKSGDILTAWQHLQRIKQDELDEQTLYLSAVCNRYLNNPTCALNYLDSLLKLDPTHARAYQEQGYNLLLLNKANDALKALNKAVKLNPSLTAAWCKLAEIYTHNQQTQLADNARANAVYYQSLPLHIRSGYSKLYDGDIAQAQRLCQTYLQHQPDHPDAMRLLAQVAQYNGHNDKAEFILDSARLISPGNLFVQYDLTIVYQNRQKFVEAYELASSLVKAAPESISFMLCCANQAAAVNQYAEAERMYLQVLSQLEKSSVDYSEVAIALGHLYKMLGKTAQAIDYYKQAYINNLDCTDAFWSLANLKNYQFTQGEFQLMLQTLELGYLSKQQQCLLSFALAHAFEAKKNYQRAACFYQSANHLRLSELNYNNQKHVEDIINQQCIYPESLFLNSPASAKATATPIFIVGLPRAGSTLLEQILASHSKVCATMELPYIMQMAYQLEKQAAESNAELTSYIASLSEGDKQQLGQTYLQKTAIYRDGSDYFIDKMPNNFKHVGLIKLILPQAKIIDVRRNLQDACMANYKQYYAQGQHFSYHLKHCANFYRGYQTLMDYWQSLFKQDLLTLEYEHLVAQPQQSISQIVEMLGIEFEPTMLHFYQTERAVKTPSSEQVRQPLYHSSINAWQNFALYLPELNNL
ncbi:sulfotransferase [Catenovulum agarivorans DS-2]|uniref:Sulfotransferase n=1 Tax=Catenovulum agarivorans DS-2 TaxID=1328313 RepID=W7QT78_9ALTE|nr:tetratricopeptide repeat-containing sulfotransferase family protein [Catenovulum agarivorans]EWH08620.1 sulfotransferase [Catenovulum agarivorans DS-2]